MPFKIVDTKKVGKERFHIINTSTGKLRAKASSRRKAELFIGFASKGEKK